MNEWSVEKAKELYGISTWGLGYFDVNESGNLIVCPRGKEKAHVDLLELTQELQERGIRCPMLLRFQDITLERIKLLNECFNNAITNYKYQGLYQGVYPIKVNQQCHLVKELVELGAPYNLGLECGSKPELLIVLAMMVSSKALILCNGFKDQEYVETAILSANWVVTPLLWWNVWKSWI